MTNEELKNKDGEEQEEVEEEQEDVVAEVKSILDDKLKIAVNEVKSETKSELEESMKRYIDEQKEVAEKKAGLYHEDVKPSRKALNESVKRHVNVVLGRDAEPLSTDVNADGGYTVDEELDAEIRLLVEEYGVARQEFFVTPMEKGAWKGNHLVTDVASAWVDEGDEFSTDAIEIGQKSLELKKLGVIVAMTNELLADSEVDLTRFVTERVAQEFAKKEDEAGFIGDESSTYGGFKGVLIDELGDESNVYQLDAGKTKASDSKLDDILKAKDKLSGTNLNPKVYMNRTMKTQFRLEKDDDGAYIFAPNGEQDTLWGMPVVEVEVLPEADDETAEKAIMVVGDLNRSTIMGYKGGFTIDEFTTGTIKDSDGSGTINLLTSDRKAVRFKERVGFLNMLPGAYTIIKTGEST